MDNVHEYGEPRPFVSIIIPVYNAETTIVRALQSALGQRGATFEVIVVNDGSTDKTLEVVNTVAGNSLVAAVISQQNSGTAGAINAGVDKSKGRFIATLAADDELAPEYLETMSAFVAEHPGYDIYSHDCWDIPAGGVRRRFVNQSSVMSVTLEDLLHRNVILGNGTLMDRDFLVAVGGYRQGAYIEDFDLWLRSLAAGARHLYCPEPLYLYYTGYATQKTRAGRIVYDSCVEILRNLISQYPLTKQQQVLVEQSIATNLRNADIFAWANSDRAKLRRLLNMVLPESMTKKILVALSHNVPFKKVKARWYDLRRWAAKRRAADGR